MKSLDEQVRDLVSAFADVGKSVDSHLEQGMEACTILVQTDASYLAPEETGLLRRSIAHRVRNHRTQIVGEVGTVTEYAAFQEFGTSKMAAQPFLTPALNQNKDKIKAILSASVRRGLNAG